MADNTIMERKELLQAWEIHFCSLNKIKVTDANIAQVLWKDSIWMTHDSLNNEDYVFDVDFEIEEVERAIECLPNGKSAAQMGFWGNI